MDKIEELIEDFELELSVTYLNCTVDDDGKAALNDAEIADIDTARAALRAEYDRLTARVAELVEQANTAYAPYRQMVQDLQARVAELETAQRWIPVEERLPKVDHWVSDSVLVCFEGYDDHTEICSYIPEDWTAVNSLTSWTYKKGWYRHPGSEPIIEKVTHWIPLPQPPVTP